MPVTSEPSPGPSLPFFFQPFYLILGLFLLLILSLFFSRKHPSPILPTSMPPPPAISEKDPNVSPETASATIIAKSRIPQPQPPPPPASADLPFPAPLPLAMPLPSPTAAFDFDSFEPAMAMERPPRRRSYTKTTTLAGGEEIQVSGEIMVAEGWRRHTRVFGGGVCKACEESERRMSA